MAAPVASYITLPIDGANTGDNVRYVQSVVGGNTVQSQVWTKTPQPMVTGTYLFSIAAQAIVASAHDGTSTGFAWIQNPVGSSILMRLRRLEFTFTNATAGAISHNSAPRIVVQRATFTGTFSGATVTVAKRKTSEVVNVGNMRTAVTGATVSLEGVCWAGLVPGNDITGAVDVFNLRHKEKLVPVSADEHIILASGECLAIFQADNGTASDQRLISMRGVWSEEDA